MTHLNFEAPQIIWGGLGKEKNGGWVGVIWC
jgi:hypothetical protein